MPIEAAERADAYRAITENTNRVGSDSHRGAEHQEQPNSGIERELCRVLDDIAVKLSVGRDVGTVMAEMVRALHEARESMSVTKWRAAISTIQKHPVAQLVHQDPFTGRSFRKPRGYSGDAHLLDFIYGHEDVAVELTSATPLGRSVYEYTYAAPAASAVRERRGILADLVDDSAAGKHSIDVLAIAAGHLREAEYSKAFQDSKVKRWVALDQDQKSVEAVATRFVECSVKPVNGTVRGLLSGTNDLGAFDVIYAAGLYDYLPMHAAVALTKKSFEMLKPGGTYLFANFSDDIPDDGFMETFMDWSLILRSEQEVQDIIVGAGLPDGASIRTYFGENKSVIYGEIRKPA